ncbi:MAG: ribbon-helix-helix domain-containing protein [Methylobacter sp.]
MAVKKRTLLSQAVQTQRTPTPQTLPQEENEQSKKRAATRIGTRMIGGHFGEPAQRQFKILAAEQDRTGQELLEEALNDLFKKYGKEPIA